MDAIIGRKLGMTRLFEEDGRVVPVTVIEAGPCSVLQVRQQGQQGQQGQNGRWMVQLGFGARRPKRVKRAEAGHAKRAGVEAVPAVVREFVVSAAPAAPTAAGQTITVAIFQPGQMIKVTGTTKGRGFQGVVKRHGFGGGPATHGNTRHRKPGSVGPGTDPSRVIKGKRMPGHMGARRNTQVGLQVVRVDAARNLLFVHGAVPGPTSGIVAIRGQGGRSRYA
jgi:large subunit ribosomal protein L3